MTKLEIAKKIIKENYKSAECGLFNGSSCLSDPTLTIYDENGLTIDICYYYEYFEVFGLSDNEFEELSTYYGKLGESEE